MRHLSENDSNLARVFAVYDFGHIGAESIPSFIKAKERGSYIEKEVAVVKGEGNEEPCKYFHISARRSKGDADDGLSKLLLESCIKAS